MAKDVVIVGGLGPGMIAYSVFEAQTKISGEWNILGILTDVDLSEMDVKVLGSTNELSKFVEQGAYVHYTLHINAKEKKSRLKYLDSLSIPGEQHASVVHPSAKISPHTKIGNGVCIAPLASSSPGSVIGDHCVLLANSFLGHDSSLGRAVTLAAHSVVGGRVNVCEGAHIGLNSTVREDIEIGSFSILGAASMLTKDLPDSEIWAGSPARYRKMVSD